MKKLLLLLPALTSLLTGCAGMNSAPRDLAERQAAWQHFSAVKDDRHRPLTRAQADVARESLTRASDTPASRAVQIGGPYVRRSGGTTFAYFGSGFPYLYIVEFEGGGSHIVRAGFYTTEGKPLRGNPWR